MGIMTSEIETLYETRHVEPEQRVVFKYLPEGRWWVEKIAVQILNVGSFEEESLLLRHADVLVVNRGKQLASAPGDLYARTGMGIRNNGRREGDLEIIVHAQKTLPRSILLRTIAVIRVERPLERNPL